MASVRHGDDFVLRPTVGQPGKNHSAEGHHHHHHDFDQREPGLAGWDGHSDQQPAVLVALKAADHRGSAQGNRTVR